MNTHTITITLSETAQRAALLAGEPAAQEQTYEVPQELVGELLQLPWAKIDTAGTARCAVPTSLKYGEYALREERAIDWSSNEYYGRIDLPCDARPADAAAALSWGRTVMATAAAVLAEKRRAYKQHRDEIARRDAAEAAKKAEELAARAGVQAAALDAWERDHAAARAAGLPGSDGELEGFGGGHGDGFGVVEALKPRLQALRAELRRQDDAEKERREAAKASQRHELVRAWGSESQRARLAEGLLPDDERNQIIRERVLAPLSNESHYQPIQSADLERDDDSDSDACDEGHDVKCSIEAAGSLTAERYERLLAIRSAADSAAKAVGGQATVEARLHKCWCRRDGCFDSANRYGARVRIAFGELTVTQEYALG